MDPVPNNPENATSQESNQAVVEKPSGTDEHVPPTPRPDLDMDPVPNNPENATSQESNQAVVEKSSVAASFIGSTLHDAGLGHEKLLSNISQNLSPKNMASASRKYTVQEVLAILDGNASDFGSDNESDEAEDVPLPAADGDEADNDENSDGEDADATDSSDDNTPLANIANPARTKKTKKQYKWQKKPFQPPDIEFTGPTPAAPELANDEMETPLQYFRQFFTADMLELIVQQTNQYSLQKTGTCLNTSVKELEQLIGMVLRMGVVQMPGIRDYWETHTRYAPVADIMSRNRFQLLLRSLHFVDNEGVPDDAKSDKLWKIRPFLDMFREQCLVTTPGEHQSIDEMMVAFKGRFSKIKQYLRSKPTRWGFKIWCRCSISGILHDFDVYQGKNLQARQANSLGVAGDVIVKLTDTLPPDCNYKIYADNLFTSVALAEKLQAGGFQYTGTIRSNRLAGCVLESEKVLSKRGRGSFDYRVELSANIVCVRWMDTKAVTLLSTCTGPQPTDKAQRWNKNEKEYVDVDRPRIVTDYNSYMGGIDLLDSCAARYKYPLRSRRWYMYIFWHVMCLGCINAWLLFRRHSQLLGKDQKRMYNLRQFQAIAASGLIEVNTTRKRGRPGTASPPPPKAPRNTRIPPNSDSRKDQIAHWPIKVEKRQRCAFCVKIKTDTNCEKCRVPLCFTENRNCFRQYHIA